MYKEQEQPNSPNKPQTDFDQYCSLFLQILNENMSGVPVEVALLIKLGAGPEAESSNVTPALLDWFDLEDELILVFERPACSMDLVGHISSRPENLTEEEVKIILTQLLDAAIEMHSRGVFHRDIKLENILIERKAGIQRVRFLDFGCGTTCTPGQRFTGGKGTKEYKPPEWHERSCYMADSTTVWQLGVVMYTLLHRKLPFTDIISIIKHNPLIRPDLSHEGRHFLRHCLIKNPEDRPTLEKLRNHPWLR
ncbi:serine/threonine-protein kinase pim-1-like [Channa argus]|uniref:serine/threonine-protein kinase pim-1-like n=1 Tax=Channa argus TaxID=215402 RepID=UPI003521B776